MPPVTVNKYPAQQPLLQPAPTPPFNFLQPRIRQSTISVHLPSSDSQRSHYSHSSPLLLPPSPPSPPSEASCSTLRLDKVLLGIHPLPGTYLTGWHRNPSAVSYPYPPFLSHSKSHICLPFVLPPHFTAPLLQSTRTLATSL